MKLQHAVLLSLVILPFATVSVQADDDVVGRVDWNEIWQNTQSVLSERVEVGLRIKHFTLDEDSKRSLNTDGSFKEGYIAGTSVDRLDAEQTYFPYPYVRVKLHEYFAVGLTYERARAKTVTYFEEGTGYDGHSDGTIEMAGPALNIEGRYPNETRFTPFVQLGMVWYAVDFENDRDWSAGGVRAWRTDDTTGYQYTLGVSCDINENWGAELSLSHTEVDVDAAFYLSGNKRVSGTFPMTHDSIGIAARYSF